MIALILALASDLNIVYRVLPPLPELKTPLAGFLSSRKGAVETWEFLLTKRALAYVAFHYRQGPASLRDRLDPVMRQLMDTLAGFHLDETDSKDQTQEAGASSAAAARLTQE